jgi:hypothetical protein
MFGTKEELDKKVNDGRKTDNIPPAYQAVSDVLDKLGKKRGVQITSMALAYVMHKAPYVFPIVGGRKIEHLKSNIEGLGVELTDEEIDEIENATPFAVGFPLSMIFEYGGSKYNSRKSNINDIVFMKPAGHFDVVEKAQAPRPHKE